MSEWRDALVEGTLNGLEMIGMIVVVLGGVLLIVAFGTAIVWLFKLALIGVRGL